MDFKTTKAAATMIQLNYEQLHYIRYIYYSFISWIYFIIIFHSTYKNQDLISFITTFIIQNVNHIRNENFQHNPLFVLKILNFDTNGYNQRPIHHPVMTNKYFVKLYKYLIKIKECIFVVVVMSLWIQFTKSKANELSLRRSWEQNLLLFLLILISFKNVSQ